MIVRPATAADVPAIGQLAHALWPDGSAAEHGEHAAEIAGGAPVSTLPLALLVAEVGGELVGFVEVGLRSHADGCDPRRPVGFIEGWYVAPAHRRGGVGRALIAAAEAWSRDRGARELASDTWLDEDVSQRAHAALGFEVVDRCVHFKKAL
jgi:aminoglycoside 6'-N-acetyltransferase I